MDGVAWLDNFHLGEHLVPSKVNPLGAKGVGDRLYGIAPDAGQCYNERVAAARCTTPRHAVYAEQYGTRYKQ